MKTLPVFLPVIHVTSTAQAVAQAQIVFRNGLDGLFLIDHTRAHPHLIEAYRETRDMFPGEWIGVNFLDLDAKRATDTVPVDADGLWVDNPETLMDRAIPENRNWRYFVGASFKYQEAKGTPEEEALAVAARFLEQDVITTSGSATGSAPSREKVAGMRAAVPDRLMAIASGVSAHNVAGFMPHVDCILAATSVSSTFSTLNPARLRELNDLCHNPTGNEQ